MMNYEEFRKAAAEKIYDYIPKEMDFLSVQFGKETKINKEKDAITFIDMRRKWEVCPTIYMDDLYQRYQHYEDMRLTFAPYIRNVMENVRNSSLKKVEDVQKPDASNIICQVINTRQNEKFLEKVPHREFHDLSIIYRWLIQSDTEGTVIGLIMNSLADRLGLKEEQLYQYAMANQKTLTPTTIKTMRQQIEELMDPDITDPVIYTDDEFMFVITNEQGRYGATAILDTETLQKLAEKLDSNLYIIPSSIHELIAIRESEISVTKLSLMVKEINQSQVDLEDRLSNQIYHYDKQKQELTQATNEPYQLDDSEAAQDESYVSDKVLNIMTQPI